MTLSLRDVTPTDRQVEVFAHFLRDGTYITARDLGIAPGTVKNTLANLYVKLGAANAAQAAIVLGWLRVPEVGV